MEARLKPTRSKSLLIAAAWVCLSAATPLDRNIGTSSFDQAIASAKSAMLVSPSQAEAFAARAQAIADRLADARSRDIGVATALWLRGEAASRSAKPEAAITLLEQAERRVSAIKPAPPVYADILLSKSGAMIEVGRTAAALPTLLHAHGLFVEQRNRRGQAKALITLALLYDGARDQTSALRYFGEAIDVYTADPGLLVSMYLGRGNSFTEARQYEKAERDFARAYRLAAALESPSISGITLGNIANVRLLQGRLAQADAAIARGLAVSDLAEARSIKPTFLRLAAQSALQRGNLARARKLIDERFAGVDLTRTILTERDDHQTAYSIYSAQGDDRLALQHLAALKRLDDQATEVARSNSAALAAARFDYANQELRIAKLKADELQTTVAHEREQARMQRTVFVVAALGTALVIALLAFGIWTLRRSRDRLRIARDKVARALAIKTEFLAATSHEIRTPLNGILGMTEVMIADRQLDADTRDRLSVVHGAGVTMRALVDDILDVAKIETGKMTIEQAPLDLRRTIDEACRLWREQAEAKGLTFDVHIEDCPGWIVGDAVRLRQIVFNLLSNAVKFTPAGSVSVAVTCTGERFQVRVADTGIGIEAEAHELIFDSFRQADAGTTRQFGGTGLGLSICRSLSRAMDGDVTVVSVAGEGALFTLDLPLIAAETPEDLAEAPPILLVANSPITRAMLKALFEDHGNVACAADLIEAGEIARSRSLQRVLVEGDEAVLDDPARLFALLGRTGNAPVALLTSRLADERRVRLLAGGVDAVIEKPISKRMLVDRVIHLERALVRGAA